MTNNKYLLATASGVAVAAAAGGAQAADMAVKARPLPVAAPTWAGWYVGVSAGAAWERMSDDPVSPYATSVLAGGAPTSVRGTAFIGGGEIGYNWQTGNIVYGVEADISGLSGSFNNLLPANVAFDGAGSSSNIKWLSTIRGRLGVSLTPDWLAYVTGGLAIGQVKNTFNFGDTDAQNFVNFKSTSKTQTGWTIGGGLQHMISAHWIIGVEALYVDLGKSTYSINPQGTSKTTTFHNTATIARAKLDYKF